MAPLVAQHNDPLGLQGSAGVSDPFRAVLLLGDGQHHLAPNYPAENDPEQLIDPLLPAQAAVQDG